MIRRTLVLIGTMALLSVPAFAVCPNPDIFGSTGATCSTGSQLCGFVTPTGHSAAQVAGQFWSYTTGNPTVGAGNDNGSWASNSGAGTAVENLWFFDAGDTAGHFVAFGTWNQDFQGAPIVQDGCWTVVAPDATSRMVMTASDQDTAGNGYFAVAAVLKNPTGTAFPEDWDFGLSHAAGPGQLITLRQLPGMSVSGSVRNTATDRSVTLSPVAFPTSAFYTADGLAATDIIKGYKIYRQDVPFSKPAAPGPANRSRAAFTAVGGLQTFGSTPTVNITCTTDVNVYLAYSIVFDGATPFETDVVSANSAQPVACGPTLADPSDRKFKVIDKKPVR